MPSPLTPVRCARPLASSLLVTLLGSPLLLPSDANAWGNLGHRIVAETAARLFETDPQTGPFGSFASRQRFELGLYATLPDSAFRSRDGAQGKIEAPSHFLDLDLWIRDSLKGKNRAEALSHLNTPWENHLKTNVPAIEERHPGGASREENPARHGSLPWRISELKQKAKDSVEKLASFPSGYQAHAPMSSKDSELGHLYNWLWWAGVLAHYTGDAAVPYHASEDYNGFKLGQGGIHFYFEVDCVQALTPGIETAVLKRARELYTHWEKSPSLKEDSRHLDPSIALTLSVLDRGLKAKARANQVDLKAAVLQTQTPGSRLFAKRKPAPQACAAFRPLLIEQLAIGAAFTAATWKETLPRQLSSLKLAEGEGLFFAEPRWDYEYPAPPRVPPSTPEVSSSPKAEGSPH